MVIAKNLFVSSCICKIAAEGQDFDWHPASRKWRDPVKNRQTPDSNFAVGPEWCMGVGGLGSWGYNCPRWFLLRAPLQDTPSWSCSAPYLANKLLIKIISGIHAWVSALGNLSKLNYPNTGQFRLTKEDAPASLKCCSCVGGVAVYISFTSMFMWRCPFTTEWQIIHVVFLIFIIRHHLVGSGKLHWPLYLLEYQGCDRLRVKRGQQQIILTDHHLPVSFWLLYS